MSEKKSVAIIGAGLGGCTIAALLANKGHKVTIFEKNSSIGGRCQSFTLGSEKEGLFRFDIGASMILMTDVFEKLSKKLGTKINKKTLGLKKCTPSSVIHFHPDSNDEIIYPSANLKEEKKQSVSEKIKKQNNKKSFKVTEKTLKKLKTSQNDGLDSFLSEGEVFYECARKLALSKSYTNIYEAFTYENLLSLKGIILSTKGKVNENLHDYCLRKFENPAIAKALSLQSMYMGLSPYDALNLYSFLTVDEILNGIYYPVNQSGMSTLPKTLIKIALSANANLRLSTSVVSIDTLVQHDKEKPIIKFRNPSTNECKTELFDLVVSNADLCFTYDTLLQDEKKVTVLERMKYGCSTVSFYWALDCKVKFENKSSVHHVFLGKEFKKAFSDIFDERSYPKSLSFYVHVPSNIDSSSCPAGKTCLTVLVPVGSEIINEEEVVAIKAMVLWRLTKELNSFDEKYISHERVMTPENWKTEFSLFKGCALGLSHDPFQLGPFRPSNQDQQRPWLYFVGANTQPGCGVPTVIHSAMNTFDLIEEHTSVTKVKQHFINWENCQNAFRSFEWFGLKKGIHK